MRTAGPPAAHRAAHRAARRRGAALPEFFIVYAVILFPLTIGLWEMGRAVQVQQIVANAAREGARLAAQGRTIKDDGGQAGILASVPPASNATQKLPNVKAAVYQSLVAAGLTALEWDDVRVAFTFTSAGDGTTDPVTGSKLQQFKVSVSIDFDDKVRWVNLGIVNPATIDYTVGWQMMVDDKFQISTDIPKW